MLENLRLSFQSIRGHKLRSLLTTLGVIIGIASIIAIVSTIKGTNDQIKENLIGSGTNTVEIALYEGGASTDFDYDELPVGVPVLTTQTRAELEALDNVERASLYTERTYVDGVYFGNTPFNGNVLGVDELYFTVYGYQVYLGRGFTDSDFAQYRSVVILDQTAANTLFGGANPLGEVIEIKGQPFTVIGVVQLASDSEPEISSLSDYYTYTDTGSGTMFLPDSVWPAVYCYDEPQNAAIRCSSTDDMTTVGQAAAALLNAGFVEGTSSDYSYESQDLLQQAQQLQALSSGTNIQLMWIAGISLLVGGIGVMNIMLVPVTERTREIGLKKALGAKKSRILLQFLTEAAVLTGLGGILGVAAGIAAAKVISSMTGAPTGISVPAIAVAVAFSVLIGILFGLIPAVKAANLNPIEALRRE